ncbi:SHOCT-like domain-containing protein [Candidatus Leptofilum sp.]|uniref:SHOCT-like domain-containing protein n=1 Tax=Candidatus Leptofilum sp. TaxID=3241576 RepID=UPI003B5CE35E
MKEERTHILDMLKNGKISVDEADLLLEALGDTAVSSANSTPSVPPVPPTPPIPPKSINPPRANPKLTAEQILQLNREGADPDFIRAVRQLHDAPLSGDQIVHMALEGVEPEFITAVSKLEDLSLNGDQIVQMGIEGVHPEFLTAVRNLHMPTLTGDHIVLMGIEGVTKEFIQQIKEADFLQELDADAFVQMAIEDVDGELLKETIQLL